MTMPQRPSFRSTGDLAAHLGLSRWAVSRVLNGQPGVSDATRQRVEALIAESGFQPNRMARGLRGGATGLVGVMFQELESPALARKAAQLQKLLRAAGYKALIELCGGDQEWEAETIRHFSALRVEGMVLVGVSLSPRHLVIRQMAQQNVPTVLVDPAHPLPMPSVYLDRARGLAESVQLLHSLGHRRLALLGLESDPVLGPPRLQGVQMARVELGLPAEAVRSFHLAGRNLQDFSYGADLARLWAAEAREHTAILANNDRIAIGAMGALRELGLIAPRDYSIIGFDNTDVSAWVEPALTSIDQQIETMMGTAVGLLQELLGRTDPVPDRPRLIAPRLVARATTGPVPA